MLIQNILYPVSDKYAFEDNGDKTDKEDSENQQEKNEEKESNLHGKPRIVSEN